MRAQRVILAFYLALIVVGLGYFMLLGALHR
jgi:hypothetical protein